VDRPLIPLIRLSTIIIRISSSSATAKASDEEDDFCDVSRRL